MVRSLHTLRHRLAAEHGSALLDVLVAAVVLLIVTGATLTAFSAADGRSGEQKAKSVAQNLALNEVDRVRSLPFDVLRKAPYFSTAGASPAAVTEAGRSYTISSKTEWAGSPVASASSCKDAARSPQSLKLTTTVTWDGIGARRPVTLTSLVAAPPNANANTGSVVVQVTDRQGLGVGGLLIKLSGPQALQATTDENGCVRFTDLAPNTYYVSFSDPPKVVLPSLATEVKNDPVLVTEGQTSSRAYQFDAPEASSVTFVANDYTKAAGQQRFEAAIGDVGYQLLKANGTNDGTPIYQSLGAGKETSTITVPPALVNGKTYQVYAGTCASANPTTIQQRLVMPGKKEIPLPSTRVQVALAEQGGRGFQGVRVYYKHPCGTVYGPFITNTDGWTTPRGLPYGLGYRVCGEAMDNGVYYRKVVSLDMKSYTAFNEIRITDTAGVTPNARCSPFP